MDSIKEVVMVWISVVCVALALGFCYWFVMSRPSRWENEDEGKEE